MATIVGMLTTLGSNDVLQALSGTLSAIVGKLQILIIRGGGAAGLTYPRRKRSTLDEWDKLDGLVRKRNGKWK